MVLMFRDVFLFYRSPCASMNIWKIYMENVKTEMEDQTHPVL